MPGQLITPPDQRRSYELFILPNQLEVITISDPETMTASAALQVKVGSNCDPPELLGLAHFIEHMLFLGTEKFPKEDTFQTFLSEHNGFFNASTCFDTTDYYFSVTHDHLHHVLDMFSDFFVHPLFTASATEREMRAIESEHSKNIPNDLRRFFEFLKVTSSPEHPFSKFSTGNLTTLRDQPKAKGIDTRKRMIEHYEKHYSANLMKLVVYGKEPSDVLRAWVEKLFKHIPNRDLESPLFPGVPFTKQELGFWYNVATIDNSSNLNMVFPLDVGRNAFRTCEIPYVGFLLSHEGKGSILNFLKEKGWAESLCAGSWMQSDNWALFVVDIGLTVEGVQHIKEAITAVFQYVQHVALPGVSESIFKELRAVDSMRFQCFEVSSPSDLCNSVVSWMAIAGSEYGLAGGFSWLEYDESRIRHVLDLINPENMNVYALITEFADTCTETISPWYNIKYCRRTLDPEEIACWKAVEPDPALHLPIANPFIPENLDVKPVAEGAPDHPVLIYKKTQPQIKVWFMQEKRHHQPKAVVRMHLVQIAGATPRQIVLNELFAAIVEEHLNPLGYHAGKAGLQYFISSGPSGLFITVGGFSDKVGVMVKEILQHIKKVEVSAGLFKIIQDQYRKMLQNFANAEAHAIASEAASVCSGPSSWAYHDMSPIVDDVTPEELRIFIRAALKQFSTQLYFHGNLLEADVMAIVQDLEDILLPGLLPTSSNILPQVRTCQYPEGKEWVRPVLHPNGQGNSAAYMIMQMPDGSPHTNAMCAVFTAIASGIFFIQLRTIESLGYTVDLSSDYQPWCHSITCVVQSNAYDPLYLYSRIYGFFDALEDYLVCYDEGDLQAVIDAQISIRREESNSLMEEAGMKWGEISCHEFMWDRQKKEIAELEKITKDDLMDFFQKYISNSSAHRRRLTTLVFAAEHQAAYDKICNGDHCVQKCISTQLPAYKPPAKAAAPVEFQRVLSKLDRIPSRRQSLPVIRALTEPVRAPSALVTRTPSEAPKKLTRSKSVFQLLPHRTPRLAPEESIEDAESPLLALFKYNAAVPRLDLHYILDPGLWKQTLALFPMRAPWAV